MNVFHFTLSRSTITYLKNIFLEKVQNLIHLLDEVEVFQLRAKHNEVEGRFCLQLPGIGVDGVKELEGVGGAGDVTQLPVHLDIPTSHLSQILNIC